MMNALVLMFAPVLLIFEPIPTWERIWKGRPGPLLIFILYLLPLLALTSLAEGYRLSHSGREGQLATQPLPPLSIREAIVYETGQALLFLVIILFGAKVIKAIGETFHGRHTYQQAFITVAYGLSPWLLFRFLDFFPAISPWVSWGVGIMLSIAVLYQGVPRIMEPDPPNAFGLYLMSSLLLFLVTGLVRFMTVWFLQGRFVKLEAMLSGLAARLPF
jgi:hypothetical protein